LTFPASGSSQPRHYPLLVLRTKRVPRFGAAESLGVSSAARPRRGAAHRRQHLGTMPGNGGMLLVVSRVTLNRSRIAFWFFVIE
jgi:hypothetical protein